MGILFDLIGVAVTVAEEKDFHAKASKKIKGAKTGLKLIKHSSKVSNFCADVIGDICGVLSGAISALIALKLTEYYKMGSNFQFIISALVASLTIGGKAFSKDIAKNNSTKIISIISKILYPDYIWYVLVLYKLFENIIYALHYVIVLMPQFFQQF